MVETFFDLPTEPDEFGVVLTPAKLRRLDFSALEFPTIRRAVFEYIKTYFPSRFNDFQSNNGIIMLAEVQAYIGGLLSQRSDVLVDASFLPTSQTFTAVDQHLQLINNRVQRATPAVVDIEVSVQTELFANLSIPAGTSFTLTGSDGEPVTYEIYRAPGDFTNDVQILAGTRAVIAFGIEGRFATPKVVESAGGPFQEIRILDTRILENPIVFTVTTGSTNENWTRIDTLEQADPTDKVFEVKFDSAGMTIRTGDDQTGRALLAGQVVTIRYRVGGGQRGRISTNAINDTKSIIPNAPITAPVLVRFRNLAPSNGGEDQESLTRAKARAPKESAALSSATSGEDYAVLAREFNHPVFGSVLKALATVRTSINANIVELYVLAAGPDNIPVQPSLGLKQGLETFFEDINVLTDQVKAFDAFIKPITVRAKVIVSRSADPSIVKDNVDATIQNFFNVDNFELGKPLYLSSLYEALQSIEGVQFVKIFEPQDDILATKELKGNVTDETNKVALNELIILGDVQIEIFFEPTSC